jgi:hypothetical protein
LPGHPFGVQLYRTVQNQGWAVEFDWLSFGKEEVSYYFAQSAQTIDGCFQVGRALAHV